jgi:hypothetical protein
LPFGPWVQTFRDGGTLPDIAADLTLHPVWRAELARLFPELADPGGRSPETAADYTGLFEAVAHVLTTLAQPALLLVLEDLHWADELSLRLLAFVTRRVKRGSIVVVLSAREDELAESPVLRQLLTELARDGRAVELRLSPLSRDATFALVGALARSGMEQSALERLGEEILHVSEGNPFMVVETMRALHEGTATVAVGHGLPLPARVRDTVGRRLDRLSDHGRRLASVAATIGRAFDFGILQQSAGLSPAETAEAVEDLVGRRILHAVGERLDFTHQWIRRTAYERLLPPLRRLQAVAFRLAREWFGGRASPVLIEELERLPTDGDLVDACEQWLAVTGTADMQVEQYSQATEGPAITSRPIQIPSMARDLLASVGVSSNGQ